MAKEPSNGRFGDIKSSKKKFHTGEPVFLIRGTDPFAANTVIEYARRCEREGADPAIVNDAFDHAMRVAEWQRQNPELVKPLPD
jgi:hypothetical protein